MPQVQVRRGEGGYAMAALLVAMALMAVMMSVAMPVWRHASQREKEAELVWRGQQYDRAIQLFRRKTSAPGPPNLDILIQQKFLRKQYKDPITGADFELRPVGAMGPGTRLPGMPGGGMARPGVAGQRTGPGSQRQGLGSQSGRGRAPGNSESEEPANTPGSGSAFGGGGEREPQAGMGGPRAPGQLIGAVRSKSKARSIRELNGRTRYDQWEFVYVPYNPNPQASGLGTAPAGQPRTPGRRRPGSTSPGSTSPETPRPGAGGSSIQ